VDGNDLMTFWVQARDELSKGVFGLEMWWLFVKVQYLLNTNHTFKSYKNMFFTQKSISHFPFKHLLTRLFLLSKSWKTKVW
jgi:hypothetical protein